MARRSEHSREQIKQMVLNAAEEIIQEQGFSALKVRKIAADIGYTVGSIYMVFSNMNDLNMHIKARTWQKMLQHLKEVEQSKSAANNIEKLALAYLEFSVENIGLWRMLFEHQLPVGENVPDWYEQECEEVVVLLSVQLQQLASEYSDLQVQQAAQALNKAIQGVCMQSIIHKQSPAYLAEVREELVLLVDCYLRGWQQN
jgi:AcrR family transcriptional regulator